jgi:hypothetical protein
MATELDAVLARSQPLRAAYDALSPRIAGST